MLKSQKLEIMWLLEKGRKMGEKYPSRLCR